MKVGAGMHGCFVCGLAFNDVLSLHAPFAGWAEHQAKGVPPEKALLTMLAITLLNEFFPVGHFNILLPPSEILIALTAGGATH
ncbi:hypothetical protein GCM10007385_16370 [Tateyamaria omphalii]|uniref:hypothetical protein n=1 Tax=Tateyamaria omphalii TaxID=299262 RepID=UPI001678CE8A|nr:hypothetical protein [Tateyamaria omphalii]GGX48953.1 hypothetical protein GCM10007385_16370 [Tateyamaria omphalii]